MDNKEASINGHLNDHGQATISRQDLLDAINANWPAAFQVISGLPTTDLNINSTQPAPIIVKVQLANTIDPAADIIYQTPDGKIVGRSTINGNIGETVALHLQVPAGYEAIGQLPTSYTFTDAEHQQLIILVKAKTAAPDQPVSPDQLTTPDQPATLSSPRHAAQAKAAALLNAQPAQHAQAAAQKADAQRLPQTGARQLGDLSLIGFSLMSISGILALSLRRKRNL